MTRICHELKDHVVELVEGSLDELRATRLRAHLAECAACRREVRLEEELVATLRTPIPVPVVPVALPDAGDRAPRRLRPGPASLAAGLLAAAACLVVAFAREGGGAGGAGTERATGSVGPRVQIRTVVDSSGEVPLPDDDLLALTAGVEAVVMRRPAVGR